MLCRRSVLHLLALSGCQQHQEAASTCGMGKVVRNVPEFILFLHKANTQHRLPRKAELKINRHCGIFFFFPVGYGRLPGRAPFCRTED